MFGLILFSHCLEVLITSDQEVPHFALRCTDSVAGPLWTWEFSKDFLGEVKGEVGLNKYIQCYIGHAHKSLTKPK